MATHRILVPCQLPSGAIAKRGALLNYSGPPIYRFRPLDPELRKVWEKEAADPDRVAMMLERSPDALCLPDDVPEVHDYELPQDMEV